MKISANNQDVRATLRYLLRRTERPVYYASRAGVDDNFDIGLEFDEREVCIRNARMLQNQPELALEGFTLRQHQSSIDDFYCLSEQQVIYEQEISELICCVTGAHQCLVFDHTIRSDSASVRGQRATREPAIFIHNDYTTTSAYKRFNELLDPHQAQQRSNFPWAIINVWRSIRGSVRTSPIACCDASSVEPQDLVAVERRAHDRIGEIEFVTWNPGHRWYYFAGMTESEVLLIKTFDSTLETRAIHSAFHNPLAAPDAPPRESIESRVLVFFADS